MDYGKVLSKASENSRLQNSDAVAIKRYSTDFSAPKRLPSKQQGSGVQSEAVRAFLAKRKDEEERKALLAERRKQDLLELRSIAKHGRKANAMAKRTKDNNFMSNFANTAELAAEQQAGSRGGVSGGKVQGAPRLSGPPTSSSHQRSSLAAAASKTRSAPRNNGPPPPAANLNFYDLLKVANQKQHEPIKLPRIPKKTDPSMLEQGRMMTCEEKRRFIEEQARRRGQSLKDVSLPKRTRKRYVPEADGELDRATMNAAPGPPPPKRPTQIPTGSARSSSLSLAAATERPMHPTSAAATKRPMHPTSAASSAAASMSGHRFAEAKRRGSVAMHAQDNRLIAQGSTERSRVERPSNTTVRQKPGGASEVHPLRTQMDSRLTVKSPSKLVTSSKKPPPPPPRQNVVGSGKAISVSPNNGKPSKSTATVNGKMSHPAPRSLPSSAMRTMPPQQRQPPLSSPLSGRKPAQQLHVPRPSGSTVDLAKPKAKIQQRPTAMTAAATASRPQPSSVQRSRHGGQPPLPSLARPRERPLQPQAPLRMPQQQQARNRLPPAPFRQPPPRPDDRFPPLSRGFDRRPMSGPMPARRRIESDDDEDDEYDEEMDDFIDDGPLDDDDGDDYSEHIKQIFGYDRSKYRYEPDDACMESSFLQQMKEEAISAKMGILEDLEDIQREEEELKRRVMRTKKLK